jgi:hypothetical protein
MTDKVRDKYLSEYTTILVRTPKQIKEATDTSLYALSTNRICNAPTSALLAHFRRATLGFVSVLRWFSGLLDNAAYAHQTINDSLLEMKKFFNLIRSWEQRRRQLDVAQAVCFMDAKMRETQNLGAQSKDLLSRYHSMLNVTGIIEQGTIFSNVPSRTEPLR